MQCLKHLFNDLLWYFTVYSVGNMCKKRKLFPYFMFGKQTLIYEHESFVHDCVSEIKSNLFVLYFSVRIKIYDKKIFPKKLEYLGISGKIENIDKGKLLFHLCDISRLVLVSYLYIYIINYKSIYIHFMLKYCTYIIVCLTREKEADLY